MTIESVRTIKARAYETGRKMAKEIYLIIFCQEKPLAFSLLSQIYDLTIYYRTSEDLISVISVLL